MAENCNLSPVQNREQKLSDIIKYVDRVSFKFEVKSFIH